MSTLNLGNNLILDSDYSTDETPTGATWIDGKPIYRKVMSFTTTAGTYNYNISSLSVDSLVASNVVMINSVSGSVITDSYYYSSTDYFNFYINNTKTTVTFRSGSSYCYGPTVFTLWYTKTTD